MRSESKKQSVLLYNSGFSRSHGLILILCILLLISSVPGQPSGLGVFTDSLVESLAISRVAYTSALAMGTLLFGLLVPLTGWLMDRIGLRKILIAAPIALAIMFLLLTQLPRLTQLSQAGGVALRTGILAGFFLIIRLLAQGCMGVGSRVVICSSFQRRRGLATGIFTATTTLTFNLLPPLLNNLVEAYGWRTTYSLLAVYLLLVPPLCVVLFLRPLSNTGRSPKTKTKTASSDKEHPLALALRTGTFWICSLGLAFQAMFMTSIKIHMTDLGAAQGLSRGESYQAFVPMAFVALATNLLGGWLSDRIRLGRLLGLMMGAQIAASLSLVTINTVWGRALFAFGYGLGVGLFGILNVVTWPRLFGQYALGRIVSMGMSVIILTTAIGPVLFSLVKALAGTYQIILYFWPMLAVSMIILCWRVEENFHTEH